MSFRKLILFICFLFSYISVFAQAQVYVRVDKTYVEVKEEINLTLSVSSDSTDIGNPTMPSLPNFNIYSSGQSRNVSMINGKVSVNMRFNYILSPRFAGKSTIKPFTVEVNGKIYKTEPIEIEVYRSGQGISANNSAGQNPAYANAVAYKDKVKNTNKKTNTQTSQTDNRAIATKTNLPDFFMMADVDKKEAYLNEQINLKIRFYQSRSTFGNPQYERPKMEGFVFEDIKTNQGYETLAGTQYHYIEFETALFGILPGKATIGAAKVEYIPSNGVMDAFDMFFSSSSKPRTVDTDPIDVLIKPLPTQGKSADFSGAVGSNFKIESQVDKPVLAVGETLVLTTTISGVGNMRAVDALPTLDLGPSFRIYDSTSSLSSKITAGKLGGTKEFKTIIVPRTSGSFTIPAIAFQYFNPQTSTYETIRSKEIALRILPAKDEQQENSIQFYSQDNAPQGKRVEKISSDIYYLKNEETSLFTKILTAVKDFGKYNYLLFAVLGLALLISFISKGEFEFLSNQKAYLRARRKISKAKTINDIAPALQEYLSAKQGQNIGITTVAQSAKNLKLETSTCILLNNFWQELEMLKYAPADTLKNTVALKQSVQKALNLIKQIEKEAK